MPVNALNIHSDLPHNRKRTPKRPFTVTVCRFICDSRYFKEVCRAQPYQYRELRPQEVA